MAARWGRGEREKETKRTGRMEMKKRTKKIFY